MIALRTRYCTVILLLLLLPLSAFSREVEGVIASDSVQDMRSESKLRYPKFNTLALEARVGWEQERNDGTLNKGNTGFKGQYFNLKIDAEIVENLKIAYRQRLNKPTDRTFWDGTDYLLLNYKANEHWSVGAGKQIVQIGGTEYDYAPIHLYYCSEFWNQIACYQLGVSTSYTPNQKDYLTLQLCNSPFRHWAGNNSYAINLYWNTHRSRDHFFWEPRWSVNAMQLGGGRWMNYLSLGNMMGIGSKVLLAVDYINRASSHQPFLSDFSLVGKLDYSPKPQVNVFLKYAYDQNKSGTDADKLVTDGTQIHMVSAGVEVNPIKKYRNALRLFAVAGYNWGTNTNSEGVKQDRQLMMQAGVYINLDVLEGLKHIKL